MPMVRVRPAPRDPSTHDMALVAEATRVNPGSLITSPPVTVQQLAIFPAGQQGPVTGESPDSESVSLPGYDLWLSSVVRAHFTSIR